MFNTSNPTLLRRSVSILALMGAMALGACETTGTSSAAGAQSTASELPAAPLADDPLSQAAYWGARYEEDPSDTGLAVRYSSALRQLGSAEESSIFMSRVASESPNDADVLAEYAKSLIGVRRGEAALTPLARVIVLRPNDWQMYSLEGVAHDQMGEHSRATESYERALQISPNNPSVLNNYALSRALAGDLDGAEAMLQAAVSNPEATAQTRQNLALVLGLRGDFNEAERLARADLPPQAVDNNLAYYRSMLTQPAAWSELEAEEAPE